MEFHADNPEEEEQARQPGKDDGMVFTHSEVEKLHKVKEYIDNNLERTLTIALLAKKFHIGTTHLKLGFRKYFNSTVYQYILQQRMETAKQLLISGMRVRQVAAEIGYSLTGFSKVFKIYTGVSPIAYKNMHQ